MACTSSSSATRSEVLAVDGQLVERIVRVGTHRVDGRLPRRVRQHFASKRGGSIFRHHLGSVLLARDDPKYPRIAQWLRDRRTPFPDVEGRVSRALREEFTFCWVRVDTAAERLALEKGLIAVLAQHPLGTLSLPFGSDGTRDIRRSVQADCGTPSTIGPPR